MIIHESKDKPRYEAHPAVVKKYCAFVGTINDKDYYIYRWETNGKVVIPRTGSTGLCYDLYPPEFEGDQVALLIYGWWKNTTDGTFSINKLARS